MSKLEIFEPAMCCPTGVCGVSVDPVLVQFNADVQALAAAGVEVLRHSLSHEPAAFAGNPAVVAAMASGMDQLPIVTVDGRVVSMGLYPSREQLLSKLGLAGASAGGSVGTTAGGCGCAPGKCC